MIGEHWRQRRRAPADPGALLHALLYRELGVVLHRLSCRDAAIACYEDGLKVVVQRLAPGMICKLRFLGASLLAKLRRSSRTDLVGSGAR